MSRRLNQEQKQLNTETSEEAWKFVTLNPAKLLHIDEVSI
jgi:imidazolonepropionase-like amidohydrolase